MQICLNTHYLDRRGRTVVCIAIDTRKNKYYQYSISRVGTSLVYECDASGSYCLDTDSYDLITECYSGLDYGLEPE